MVGTPIRARPRSPRWPRSWSGASVLFHRQGAGAAEERAAGPRPRGRRRPRRHRVDHLDLEVPRRRDLRHRRRRGQRPARAGRGASPACAPSGAGRSSSTASTSRHANPRRVHEMGVGPRPEDRNKHGVVEAFTIADNLGAQHLRAPPVRPAAHPPAERRSTSRPPSWSSATTSARPASTSRWRPVGRQPAEGDHRPRAVGRSARC